MAKASRVAARTANTLESVNRKLDLLLEKAGYTPEEIEAAVNPVAIAPVPLVYEPPPPAAPTAEELAIADANQVAADAAANAAKAQRAAAVKARRAAAAAAKKKK